MELVVADTESFWSTEHSLTKLNSIVYCMHPDTEIISVSIKVGSRPTECAFGEENIRSMLNKIDWSDKLLVFHNAPFDAVIWAWRFGIKPKLWGCTLAMARPHHALTVGGSLSKLVAHYGLGVKDATALNNTKGKHLCDFTHHELAEMEKYNIADTEQCAALFHILKKLTPAEEMLLIDQTIRMLVEPQFECDVELLEDALAGERFRKKQALVDMSKLLHTPEERAARRLLTGDDLVDDVRAMLASAPKFSAFLKQQGVEVPMKESPTNPGTMTPALAKTDEGFIELQNHDNPIVSAAAMARLGVKSTLLETRLESFLEVAEHTNNMMPIGLNYYAAHTGRWGGGLSLNQQNLPRVSGKPTDALRNSLRAPKGKKIIVSDLSGIELRMNMFLWQVPYAMELFQQDPAKADLYKKMAAAKFGVPVEEVTKDQRQLGKLLHLLCGYGGAGGAFKKSAKTMGKLELEQAEADSSVKVYRVEHPEVVQGWRTCHLGLEKILGEEEVALDPWGLCYTTKGGIKTPKGMIRYPDLRKEYNDKGKEEYLYGQGRNKSRIYGGRIDENLVQSLSRYVLSDAMLEFEKRTGTPVALCVHDEIVAVVPEKEADAMLGELQSILRTPPKWFPQLVVWSEGDIADTYGDAK